MRTSYRDDPRYKNARRRYVDEYQGVNYNDALALRMMAIFDMHAIETGQRPQFGCPYCSRPEGWDACPVHRDGQ